MTNSIHYNDNIIAFPTRPKTEWFVDLSDTSITIDHSSDAPHNYELYTDRNEIDIIKT